MSAKERWGFGRAMTALIRYHRTCDRLNGWPPKIGNWSTPVKRHAKGFIPGSRSFDQAFQRAYDFGWNVVVAPPSFKRSLMARRRRTIARMMRNIRGSRQRGTTV